MRKGSEILFALQLLDVLVQCSWWPGRVVGEQCTYPVVIRLKMAMVMVQK